ncbi:class II aldolase/adducin family protein [Massilia sp. YIM B02769]|uniref:class II aldolase/adducin family protein n=2 Tax=unclassified Massilia TaxID=2609279 RepID=UPI0025CA46A4|nr:MULTISPECIES: class II aldolase/adducin family protein [unclassified Massilia]MDN4061352.1 class II aldolase/adducin family protein [Massilia sp. YIM B02769]
MRDAVVAFCAAAGKEPLLVQGAGGNVSWKDGDTLWIKASGTWLADAAEKDIFVPVELAQLRAAVAAGQFDVKPVVRGESALRPSIETLLHALMPQPVVVHLHAVEVLAHLVDADFVAGFEQALPASISWVAVPYRKPGADLARAVSEALTGSGASVVFLQNHGVVIGADSPAAVTAMLDELVAALRTQPAPGATAAVPAAPIEAGGTVYEPVPDAGVQRLATDPVLFERLSSQWALYPDHVVFLGAFPYLADSPAALEAALAQEQALPELVFVRGAGVFARPGFSTAKQVQLRCYFDVLVRQTGHGRVLALGTAEIGELLDWDAERYRMSLSKQ